MHASSTNNLSLQIEKKTKEVIFFLIFYFVQNLLLYMNFLKGDNMELTIYLILFPLFYFTMILFLLTFYTIKQEKRNV